MLIADGADDFGRYENAGDGCLFIITPGLFVDLLTFASQLDILDNDTVVEYPVFCLY